MGDFKRLGAIAILFSIISGLVAEARYQIKENTKKIIIIETKEEYIENTLKEIKDDVKYIRNTIRDD